jgi:hypothetical protein
VCIAALFALAVATFSLESAPRNLAFGPTSDSQKHPVQTSGVANYARDEVDTFYTYPEWYIVWSYQSKADFQARHLPSGYSYFGDIGQFWQAYSRIYAYTRRTYPFATGDHIMLAVIGSSLTVEYTLKGLYENSLGHFSVWTSGYQIVPEDRYAADVAQAYAAFVHIRPFYEFSFAHALRALWSCTPFTTTHWFRSVERRAWLSLDYAVEAVYCEIIEVATHLTYGTEDVNTAAWIIFPDQPALNDLTLLRSIRVVRQLGGNEAIVEIPRYQPFTDKALRLLRAGVRFRQVAGNGLIVISAIAPNRWTKHPNGVQLLLTQKILTNPAIERAVFLARVSELHEAIPSLEAEGLTIEHLYDY